ncbi:MAG: zinc ribbon domain-containing protein [Thermoplasmata archaeon]|nr:zinc ribbon domain-containing protein [Thermoplasmata archaeon]
MAKLDKIPSKKAKRAKSNKGRHKRNVKRNEELGVLVASCPNCNSEVKWDSRKCSHCGIEFASNDVLDAFGESLSLRSKADKILKESEDRESITLCPHCRADVPLIYAKCPYCGHKFDSENAEEDALVSSPPEAACPDCDASIPFEVDECPNCGCKFEPMDAAETEEPSYGIERKEPKVIVSKTINKGPGKAKRAEEAEYDSFMCPECRSEVSYESANCLVCGARFEGEEEERLKYVGEAVEEIKETEGILEGPEEGEEEGILKAEEDEEHLDFQEEEAGEGPLVAEAEPVDRFENLKRDKALFFIGIAQIAIGGPVLAFGSILHDWFKVPIVGDTYGAFGPINSFFAIVGLIALIIGLVFFFLALRGGLVTIEEDEKLETEGGDA